MRRHDWSDEQPTPPRVRVIEKPDPAVTFIDGRGFRCESSIRDPDNVVTQGEHRVMGDRAREAAESRLAERDRQLALAVQVGAALRELEGKGR